MKILLTILLLSVLPFAAHAENLRPSGWSANGNNKSTGNSEKQGGNKIWSREEMKERKAEAASSSSFWSSDKKPEVLRDAAGETHIKRVMSRNIGKKTTDGIWSDWFN